MRSISSYYKPAMVRFLALGLVLSACGPIGFNAELKGEGTVAGAGGLGGVLTMFPQLNSLTNIDFEQNQDFKNNNASRSQVSSVLLQTMTLKIVSPNTQDFSFLDSVQFVARSGENEVVFAQKASVASAKLTAPNPTLLLDTTNVDLAQYIRASTMSIVMRGTGRQPMQDTRIEVNAIFRVAVKL